MFGLVLYSLDRLYSSVKRHAEASGEWHWLVLISYILSPSCKMDLDLCSLGISAR